MKFDKAVPAQPEEDWLRRALYCASMLHLHKLLTDAERKKVHDRMTRQKAKETEEKTNGG